MSMMRISIRIGVQLANMYLKEHPIVQTPSGKWTCGERQQRTSSAVWTGLSTSERSRDIRSQICMETRCHRNMMLQLTHMQRMSEKPKTSQILMLIP